MNLNNILNHHRLYGEGVCQAVKSQLVHKLLQNNNELDIFLLIIVFFYIYKRK